MRVRALENNYIFPAPGTTLLIVHAVVSRFVPDFRLFISLYTEIDLYTTKGLISA